MLKPLASSGITGLILAILLWKFLPALSQFRDEVRTYLAFIRDSIERSSKADMLRLIASPHVADSVKEAAAEILNSAKAADDEINRIEEARTSKDKAK